MENARLISSKSSTGCGLQPPPLLDHSLPLKPQPPLGKRRYPRLRLSEKDVSDPRKRIIAANRMMQKLYPQSKYRSSLWSPELRFAMRAVGKASSPCLTIQDLMEGKDIFRAGLSQLPDELFRKVYVAKRASRDCILSRLSTNLREIDALEKMKDVILEMHKKDGGELAAISKDLELFKTEAATRGDSIDEDIAYRHAVYADELTALTSTNTQLSLMSSDSDPESTSDESESVMSDELDGSSVAEVAEEGNQAEY
ncbi:hypothetical protein EV363DRAFT_1450085 [Boletus edulis]|nr:hypothetical protein EV363DRAFT_1450085 [Boletus edulis]